MAILIKDREADELIRALAGRTGESITAAVKQAVRDRLKTLPPTDQEIAERKRKIDVIIAKGRKLRTVDDRSPDEIIGYNELGHFD
ncbi:MAG: type II toxin-antitoxin system VapB family antitoxin [Xanthobacteraceae bacterium]